MSKPNEPPIKPPPSPAPTPEQKPKPATGSMAQTASELLNK